MEDEIIIERDLCDTSGVPIPLDLSQFNDVNLINIDSNLSIDETGLYKEEEPKSQSSL